VGGLSAPDVPTGKSLIDYFVVIKGFESPDLGLMPPVFAVMQDLSPLIPSRML
jgi:hypothetical protein